MRSERDRASKPGVSSQDHRDSLNLGREIERVIADRLPSDPPTDIALLEHISPIGWDNVVLYGQYKLDRDLIGNLFVIGPKVEGSVPCSEFLINIS